MVNKAQQEQKKIMYHEIIAYRRLHPAVSYRDIGKLPQFNISGQRVHQIMLLMGEVKRGVNKPPIDSTLSTGV